jgi:hypothetical protein
MARPPFLQKSTCASLLLTIGLQSPTAAQQVEVVDNSPFDVVENGISVPAFAVRPLTAAGFGETGQPERLQQFRLTKKLIADAAAQFGEVRAELARRALAPEDVPLPNWREILDTSGYTDTYLLNPTKAAISPVLGDSDIAPKIVMSDYAASPEYKVWDATTIMNMVATGAIDTDHVEVLNVDGDHIETVRFASSVADKLGDIYKSKPFFEQQSPYEAGVLMAALQNGIREYDSLERALLEYIGDITFGEPIIYTAAEKKLEIPSSISERYDVYWIELSASFRGIEDSDITELAVNFAFPEGGVALELIPLQYGPEVEVQEKQAIPGVEVSIKGLRAAIGEAFNRIVAFTYIKPTIVAVGLRERQFSWLLRGEAVTIGSHRFVVVAGVPKGEVGIDFAMSGHVRLRKGILEGLFASGDIAGTEVKVIPISF